jgi:hypothetical protein
VPIEVKMGECGREREAEYLKFGQFWQFLRLSMKAPNPKLQIPKKLQ